MSLINMHYCIHTDVKQSFNGESEEGPAPSKTETVWNYDGNMAGTKLEVPFINPLFVHKLYRWVI